MYTSTRVAMTFGEFIEAEKKRLKLHSNREFASKAGVSPQLINDVINEKPRNLDIVSLAKIAEYTGSTLITLLKLAFPDVVKIDLDAEARLDAERISKLPPNKKSIARGYIADAYTKGEDE